MDPTAEKIADLVAKDDAPTIETLPTAPPGFSDAEVKALAERAIDIATRGVAPGLSKMSPSAAFDFVFANQYPATTESSKEQTKAVAGRYDWEWAWASRFETEPAIPPRFLNSSWRVQTEPHDLGDGTSAKVLRVTLSVAVEHLIPAKRATTDSDSDSESVVLRPIVMQRTVIVQGLEPLGGPKWWPGIGLQARPLFGGKCAPVNGAILTPATRPSTLQRDFDLLSRYIKHPQPSGASGQSDAEDLTELVEKYCEELPPSRSRNR